MATHRRPADSLNGYCSRPRRGLPRTRRQAAAASELESSLILRLAAEDEVRPLRLPKGSERPPFLRGQIVNAGQAPGLVLLAGGITVAGQRRIHTGFAVLSVIPGKPRDTRSLLHRSMVSTLKPSWFTVSATLLRRREQQGLGA